MRLPLLPLLLQDGPIYTISSDHDFGETVPDDIKWWNLTHGAPTAVTPLPAFLRRCITSRWVGGRWISYNATLGQHRRVVPNVVTLAAVLDAVPLEPAAAAALGATTKVRQPASCWMRIALALVALVTRLRHAKRERCGGTT